MQRWMLKVVDDVFQEVGSPLAVLGLGEFEMGKGDQRQQARYQQQL